MLINSHCNLKNGTDLNKKYVIITLGYTVILLVIVTSLLLPVDAANVSNAVFSKDAKPFGIPYSEWTNKWWQWNMGMPKASHLREHFDPEKCDMNQEGPVWFLPDGLSGKEFRSCTIPSDKAILVPVLTGNCDNDNPQSPMSDADLLKCASEGGDFSVVSASLDGIPIKNLKESKVPSPYFNLTVPKDNVFNNIPGTFRAISDGWYVFLKPLSQGTHELRLFTNVANPYHNELNYASELTYNITSKS
jgi:hypothetical protein